MSNSTDTDAAILKEALQKLIRKLQKIEAEKKKQSEKDSCIIVIPKPKTPKPE